MDFNWEHDEHITHDSAAELGAELGEMLLCVFTNKKSIM